MKKFLAFLKELISVEGEVSSKRFLAMVFSVVLIVAIFTMEVAMVYAIMGFIATLLGITGIEKFSKNFRKGNNNEAG